jgi:hypothetical protein
MDVEAENSRCDEKYTTTRILPHLDEFPCEK